MHVVPNKGVCPAPDTHANCFDGLVPSCCLTYIIDGLVVLF